MKKTLFLAFAILLIVPLTSCSKVKQMGCALQVLMVHKAAPAVSTALQCANEAAIENDMMQVVNFTGFCTQAPDPNAVEKAAGKGQLRAIPPAICELAADAIVALTSKAVPATWQCSLVNAGATLAATITTACMAIPL